MLLSGSKVSATEFHCRIAVEFRLVYALFLRVGVIVQFFLFTLFLSVGVIQFVRS